MNGEAAAIAGVDIAFAGMNARANGYAERGHAIADCNGATDRGRRSYERHQEAISSSLDLCSTMPAVLAARDVVMFLKQVPPMPVALFGGKPCGPNDVSE